MHFFVNSELDPAFNLALEETLLSAPFSEVFMLWRNSHSVIVGRNQNTASEVNLGFVRSHCIPVIRRMSGGGAVYHDTGNINFSCIANVSDRNFATFETFAVPVVDALVQMGVPAVFSGRNDILVTGRKCSGTAKFFSAGRVLFHGTILFDADLSMLERVLTPSPEKLACKGVASVRSRVVNLKEFLPALDSTSFLDSLSRALLSRFRQPAPDLLLPDLLARARRLADRKYRSWDWNFGASPDFDYTRSLRFPSGTVSVGLCLRDGVITHAVFSGDFFGETPVSCLTGLLRGVRFDIDSITAAVAGIDPGTFFLGLSRAEFLSLFR